MGWSLYNLDLWKREYEGDSDCYSLQGQDNRGGNQDKYFYYLVTIVNKTHL